MLQSGGPFLGAGGRRRRDPKQSIKGKASERAAATFGPGVVFHGITVFFFFWCASLSAAEKKKACLAGRRGNCQCLRARPVRRP